MRVVGYTKEKIGQRKFDGVVRLLGSDRVGTTVESMPLQSTKKGTHSKGGELDSNRGGLGLLSVSDAGEHGRRHGSSNSVELHDGQRGITEAN